MHAMADHELPHHDRERVDVALLRRPTAELLRRRVRELALERAGPRDVFGDGRLRDPEVEQAGRAVDRDHHVLRRDIAMHDVQRGAALVRGLVRGVEPGERLTRDRDRDVERHASAARPRGVEQHVERHPVHELLHEHDLAARGDDVEHGDHVAVLEPRGDARLVEEHRDEVRILRELGVQSLGGDDPREALVAHESREVNGRHAAARDRLVQRVPADDGRRAVGIVCCPSSVVFTHVRNPWRSQ